MINLSRYYKLWNKIKLNKSFVLTKRIFRGFLILYLSPILLTYILVVESDLKVDIKYGRTMIWNCRFLKPGRIYIFIELNTQIVIAPPYTNPGLDFKGLNAFQTQRHSHKNSRAKAPAYTVVRLSLG